MAVQELSAEVMEAARRIGMSFNRRYPHLTAEDATQEILLRVWSDLLSGRYQPGRSPLAAYLNTVARQHLIRVEGRYRPGISRPYSGSRRTVGIVIPIPIQREPELIPARPEPESLDLEETIVRANVILDALTVEDGCLLRLKHGIGTERLTVTELAAITNRSRDQMKARLKVAIATARRIVRHAFKNAKRLEAIGA